VTLWELLISGNLSLSLASVKLFPLNCGRWDSRMGLCVGKCRKAHTFD